MDLSKSIEPRSDQMNADDLVAGPITVTIKDVTAGSPEQPVNVDLVEYPGRPYKPSKSMRRVLVAGWGKEAGAYVGRRLTLFRNPDIRFGKDVVGGIEIAAMSDIEKPLIASLTVTRGKRKPFTVQPLKEAAPVETSRDWDALIDGCTTVEELRALYKTGADENAPQTVFEAIEKKAATLNTKDD